ncbi:hypothetical protein [Clostridium cadaveris]|uniref:hypothetical protein n=1 Tax=Clostridium cadaveris TaxID=1529 RepID=UPI000C07C46F|nr:hypothetical protein [Clostridium cadaveris]
MFNSFKRENKIKELEYRVTVLETQVTTLKAQKEESKTNGNLILQIDGTSIGKVALEQLNKMQKKKQIIIIPV